MEADSTHLILQAIIGIILALGIGSILRQLTKKFSIIPYPAALLLLGMLLGSAQVEAFEVIRLTPAVTLFIFLPVLLFESAYNFELREFRRILTPGMLLATAGVIISTFIVAIALQVFFAIPIADALIFASFISSTDPIAVISIFKQVGVPKKLHLLIDGESFLNDATSIIMFRFMLAAVIGGASEFSQIFAGEALVGAGINFGVVLVGGALVGAVLGFIISEAIALIDNDSSVEITLTVILASLVFIVGEEIMHVSGIIAVLTAGLVVGNYGRTKVSPEVVKTMEQVWAFLVFVVTSIIFLLLGYEIDIAGLVRNWPLIVSVVVILYIARAVTVYLLGFTYNAFSSDRLPLKWLHVLNWGGLRGVLPIVIALSLPVDYRYRELFIQLVLGAVLFSLLFNALTIRPLIGLLNLNSKDVNTMIESRITEILILHNLQGYLYNLRQLNEISQEVYATHVREIRDRLTQTSESLNKLCRECGETEAQSDVFLEKILKRFCLHLEKAEYQELYKRRVVGEELYLRLVHSIDDQIDAITLGQGQFKQERTDIRQKFEKIKKSRYTLGGVWRRLRGWDFDAIVAETYAYYKARLLGDERVIEELEHFNESELSALGKNVIEKVLTKYRQLLEYNHETLAFLFSEYHDIAISVEEEFYNRESRFQINRLLEELGEEGLVSEQVLKDLHMLWKSGV
ncbi:MAG: Na(+)/H(+) antiporter NhaG [candidate division WS6 bacterium OLB20]|uniref:Na(+)/H(+) antiporter NhaG n=1 Tax=candidate division WS6 bacterium OLB20 TaxID=1617426 RepID=A0A136M0Z3_9BACT|nr:MAG: Na(+)/H(+) antiporter NhaG [candidate division WS6 bacterium OLB20]